VETVTFEKDLSYIVGDTYSQPLELKLNLSTIFEYYLSATSPPIA